MKETVYPELEERVVRLEGPFPVLVVPKPGFTRKIAYFVTDFGAIHRQFQMDGRDWSVPPGTAHYLEHKMFDLPGRDVSGEFAALGASVNAFTSYDMTAYYFSCTEHFSECLQLLLEFVSTPYFTPESVEKEREIIGQEIDMNDDSPDTRVFENLMRAMYRQHPIAVPILGTRKTIGEITDQVLYGCHRAFYNPKNMLLCVVGDVAPEEVARLLEAVPASAPEVRRVRQWPEAMDCPQPLIRESMEVAMRTFQLGFKCEPTGTGESAIRAEFVGDLAAEALFGESSPLYLRLYEQGWIDTSFGGGFDAIDGMAMLTCSGDSDHPEAVRDAVLAQARTLARQGLEEEAFLRMKRSALGRRVRGLDSFDSTCFRLCAYYFSGFDYFQFPRLYRQIQKEELQEFLDRVATRERCALSVIDPKETLS